MILQALVNCYEGLVKQGKLSQPGFSDEKVSFGIELSNDGKLVQIHSLRREESTNGKSVMTPRFMKVPTPFSRTSGVKAKFLYDNAEYFFGVPVVKSVDTDKNEKDRSAVERHSRECFETAKELYENILGKLDNPLAHAVLEFYDNWDVEKAESLLKTHDYYLDVVGGANLVFMLGSEFVHEDSEIQRAWLDYYNKSENTGDLSRCLVTGELVIPEKTHPPIKGIYGAQSSGAAIVTFNSPSFCSYEKEQNLNAPVSKYTAFAYTAALNYLIKEEKHRKQFGETTVLFWCDTSESVYQDIFAALLDCSAEEFSDEDLYEAMNKLKNGMGFEWKGNQINPHNRFYILGISPNAARLSVRFFYQDSFSSIIENVSEHVERLAIIPDKNSKTAMIPLWKLIKATVNDKSKDKAPIPSLTGDLLRAILTGSRYPSTLFQQVQLRIKADRIISMERMAIVKAYLLRNSNDNQIKEGLTMELNDETIYQPYLLGRLFAILEAIQERAIPGITVTIRDKYFVAASATPSVIFPVLLNLKDKHTRKLDEGTRVYWEKQISEIMRNMGKDFPAHLSLQDQGIFQLGYYHQRQKRFDKK